MAKLNSFKDIDMWKLSIEIAKDIYNLINTQPKLKKDFALSDQIRRSSISLSSNIAEGFERDNNNEFIRFLLIAKGSAGELRSQLYLMQEITIVDDIDLDELINKVAVLSKQISKFVIYMKDKRSKGEFKK